MVHRLDTDCTRRLITGTAQEKRRTKKPPACYRRQDSLTVIVWLNDGTNHRNGVDVASSRPDAVQVHSIEREVREHKLERLREVQVRNRLDVEQGHNRLDEVQAHNRLDAVLVHSRPGEVQGSIEREVLERSKPDVVQVHSMKLQGLVPEHSHIELQPLMVKKVRLRLKTKRRLKFSSKFS